MVKPRLAGVLREASAVLAFALTSLLAHPALACPSCTTRSGGGFMIPILLGAMILTPYIVTTVVLRVVRKAEADRILEDEASRSLAGASDPSSRSHVGPAAGSAPVRA